MCKKCQLGTYGKEKGKCLKCPKGTYVDIRGETSYKLCPAGTHLNREGSDEKSDCERCIPGT
jgi:hypothetical protein